MESLVQENDDLKKKQKFMTVIEEENLEFEQKIDVRVCTCVDPNSGFSSVQLCFWQVDCSVGESALSSEGQ